MPSLDLSGPSAIGRPPGGGAARGGADTSLLLIEDDVELTTLMDELLRERGFLLEIAHAGPQGLAAALRGHHDLVILDIMLPGLSGFEVLWQIRRQSAVPIIVLSARAGSADRITGLECGADDYLPKPTSADELIARIRAVLRRSHPPTAPAPTLIEVGAIRLDPASRTVWVQDEPVELTSIEFELLSILLRAAGRVVSRDEVAMALYQRSASPLERAVDVHISHLRRKLKGSGPDLIRTVRGLGYLLVRPAD